MLDFWLFLKRNLIYFHSASMSGSVRGISFSLFVSDKCFREMFQMIRGRKDSADKNYLGFQDQNFGRHFFLFSINKSIKTLPWAIRYEATKKRTCHDLRYIVPTVKGSWLNKSIAAWICLGGFVTSIPTGIILNPNAPWSLRTFLGWKWLEINLMRVRAMRSGDK